jgi:prepilin-type processing-associated H-X9-DG protein
MIWMKEWGQYDYEQGTLWPYLPGTASMRQELFVCPSDEEPRYAHAIIGSASQLDPSLPRNFSYNFPPDMAGYRDSNGRIILGIRLNQIRRPSHKFLVQEHQSSPALNESAATFNPYVGDIYSLLSTRHNRRGCQGFADGHVEMFDPTILTGKVGQNGMRDHSAYRRHCMLFVDD